MTSFCAISRSMAAKLCQMPEKMENNWEVTSTEAKIKSFTKEHENAKMKKDTSFGIKLFKEFLQSK